MATRRNAATKVAKKPARADRARAAAPRAVAREGETRMAETTQTLQCPIHDSAECFQPAMDPVISQAYAGYCTKVDWPFTRIIPWAAMDQEAAEAARAAARASQTGKAAAKVEAPARMRVEFFYSSKVTPNSQFFCDIQKARDLCEKLKAGGAAVEMYDVESTPPGFAKYNAAVTGPSAAKRAVFGAKGALEEDFGRTVPALLVFAKETDRAPEEVFPRSDKELGRLLGVEEALALLLKKA